MPRAADLDAFLDAAQVIDSATRAGMAKDRDKLNDATARHYCDYCPGWHAVTVACRSERVEEGDFRRRMDELREAWSSDARAKLAGQATSANGGSLGDKFLQVVRYNSAFMQTLWLASFPGLVDLPGHLSSNLG
ncbi:hypothetical protein OQA88_9464 [Cercophora sp. LCS_1]